jgi:hypothetical protein
MSRASACSGRKGASVKVRCEIQLDLDTGDYDFKVHNLTTPGEPVDYEKIRTILKRVVGDVDEQQSKKSRRG